MKKTIAIVAVFAMMLALAACSSSSGSNSAAQSSSAQSESSASASSAQSSASSSFAGLPDPWSDVATAEEAAQGAGIPGFVLPATGLKLTVGPIGEWSYRCMEGLAQGETNVGVPHLTVRKGVHAGNGDISGDYNEYACKWIQDVYGAQVNCEGNVEGQAKKILWGSNDFCFSITVEGQGDDSDLFGLGEEDVAKLVSNTN